MPVRNNLAKDQESSDQYAPLADDTESGPVLDVTPSGEIYGPGSGLFKSPADDDECPDEIQAAFDDADFEGMKYECTLKAATGSGVGNTYIKTWLGHYPSLDYIKKNYGPGEYIISFRWRKRGPNADGGKMKYHNLRKEAHITISDKCRREYMDYQLDQRLKNMRDSREKIRDAQLEKILEAELSELDPDAKKNSTAAVPASGSPVSDIDSLTENVGKIAQIAQALGMTREPPKPAFDFAALVPLIPSLITFMQQQANQRAEETKALYALLLSNANTNTSQMLELFKAQQGPTTGNQLMKEFMEMMKGAIDFKQMMQPEKESLTDKVFKMIEGVAPMIMGVIAAKQAGGVQAVTAQPMIAAAQGFVNSSPDFQEAIHDPEKFQALVARLDGWCGWEQADMILQVMGYPRPENCPRRPDQRFPAEDDRNGPAQEMESPQNSSPATYDEPEVMAG